MATFSYVPSYPATKDVTPRVRTASFGDGYAQRRADGINNLPETWALQFNERTDTEADAIIAFFEATNGVDYLSWTPPNESTAKKYICSDWHRSRVIPNNSNITVKFTQVFDP